MNATQDLTLSQYKSCANWLEQIIYNADSLNSASSGEIRNVVDKVGRTLFAQVKDSPLTIPDDLALAIPAFIQYARAQESNTWRRELALLTAEAITRVEITNLRKN